MSAALAETLWQEAVGKALLASRQLKAQLEAL